jgi:hypothetical protein
MGYDRWWAKSEAGSSCRFMELYHMTSIGVKKFKNMSSAGKIMPTILWDEEGLILWGCYLCGWHWTLTAVAKHEEVWMFLFVHWLLPRRNMPEVLLSHENSRPPTNVHTTAAFTKFVWTGLLHPPYSPGLTQSDFHLFAPVKDGLWKNCFVNDKALKNTLCRWLQRRESNFYQVGVPVVVQRWKETVDKDGNDSEK